MGKRSHKRKLLLSLGAVLLIGLAAVILRGAFKPADTARTDLEREFAGLNLPSRYREISHDYVDMHCLDVCPTLTVTLEADKPYTISETGAELTTYITKAGYEKNVAVEGFKKTIGKSDFWIKDKSFVKGHGKIVLELEKE